MSYYRGNGWFQIYKTKYTTVKFYVVKGVINKKTIEELEMGHYHSFFSNFNRIHV